MNSSELLSKTISFLRFPLIVGVVFIHTLPGQSILNTNEISIVGGALPIYDFFQYWISEVISRVSVPLFFFFSGFLFFYKLQELTKETYLAKLKRRIRSLFIPYVFWNFITILYRLVGELLLPQYFSGKNLPVVNWDLTEWLSAFWNFGHSFPISNQFWFIRDLMIVVLFAPLIYFCIRKFGWLFVLVLAALWFTGIPTPTGFSLVCWFFFAAGACFSLKRINFATLFKTWGARLFLFYILFSLLGAYCHKCGIHFPYYRSINILFGIFTFIGLTAKCIETGFWKVNPVLIGGSFFVYSYHLLLLPAIVRICVKCLNVQSDILLTGLYFAFPIATCTIGLILYELMLKICPTFTKIISGGRV